MKKLLTITLLATLFVGCSSDDDDQTQDYTSFVVTIETSNQLKNCVAGYYTTDGLCKKLGDLGELTQGIYSPEIRVNIDTLTRVYIFTNTVTPLRIIQSYPIEKNIKNIITVRSAPTKQVDPNSIYEWPH